MNNDMPDGVVPIYHLAYHYSFTQSTFPLGLLDLKLLSYDKNYKHNMLALSI